MKLSITLANGTFVTLESEETGLMHDVLRMVLDSVQQGTAAFDTIGTAQSEVEEMGAEKGSGAAPSDDVQNSSGPQRRSNGVAKGMDGQAMSNGAQPHADAVTSPATVADSGDDKLDLASYSQQAREDFRAFCQAINPTGDMRRVVVAAEAANRFFGIDGVNADEIGELFDLIGWRRANQFTQTIRNAARTKFGWMERIPGRSGRYAPTDFGRSKTISG